MKARDFDRTGDHPLDQRIGEERHNIVAVQVRSQKTGD